MQDQEIQNLRGRVFAKANKLIFISAATMKCEHAMLSLSIFLQTLLFIGMLRQSQTHLLAPPPASIATEAPSAAVRQRASMSAATSLEYCDAPCGKPKRLVRDSTLALQHGHSLTLCEPHTGWQQKQWHAKTNKYHQMSDLASQHLSLTHTHSSSLHSPQELRAVDAPASKRTLRSAFFSSSCSILSAICFICCCNSCNCEHRVMASATNAS